MTGTIYNVSNAAELSDALAKMTGGDTVLLAGGDYGDLSMGSKSPFDIIFDGEVTIKSADSDNPASFSSMKLSGAENITFEGITFDYTFTEGDKHYSRYFQINESSNISIVDSIFDGDVAFNSGEMSDGYGEAIGLSVNESSNVRVTGTEFFEFYRAGTFYNSSDIEFTNNEVHTVSSDGFNFAAVQNVLIEGNYFHDFEKPAASTAHTDMIQFWTNKTDVPSTDIIIRGNTLDIGEGQTTQSIFMRNEMVDSYGAGEEMFYKNILIEDNFIYNGHSHGITLGETDGLTIRNNTLVSIDSDDAEFFKAPRINVAETSKNVSITSNVANGVVGYQDQATWEISGNAFVQNVDPTAGHHYREIFIESTISGSNTSFIAAPDSEISTLGAGISATHLDMSPTEIIPAFDVSTGGDPETLIFDASYTYGPLGQVSEQDATFTWTFGDGQTAQGRVVEHTFTKPGYFPVTLTVDDGSQAAQIADATVGVAGADVLSFDAQSGQFVASGFGTQQALDEVTSAAIVSSVTGSEIDLGGPGTVLEVPKTDFSRFFGAEEFDLSMTLHADVPGTSGGEIFRVHGSLVMLANAEGAVSLQFDTDAGEKIKLVSQGLRLNDGAVHDIRIHFDGAAGTLQLFADGVVVAAASGIEGNVPPMGSWGLAFGNPWSKPNFDGTITAFDLDAVSNNYPVYTGTYAPAAPEAEPAPTEEPIQEPTGEVPPTEAPTEEPTGEAPGEEPTQAPPTQEPPTQEPPTEEPTGEAPGEEPTQEPTGEAPPTEAPTTEPEPETGLTDVFALAEGETIDLGANGSQYTVSREDLGGFFGSEEYMISMRLSADQPGESYGEVVRLHQSFLVAVHQDGNVVLQVQNDSGERTTLVTEGLRVNDGAAYDIDIRFDGAGDGVQLLVDGAVVAEAAGVSGLAPDTGFWDLTFGNPWGKKNFDGTLTEFGLSAAFDEQAQATPSEEEAPQEGPVIVDTTPLEEREDASDVLTFDATDGSFYTMEDGQASELAGSDAASLQARDEGTAALDLGGKGGSVLSIDRNDISDFFEAEAFDLSMTLQADQPDQSWGEIARVHNALTLSTTKDGDLSVQFISDLGEKIKLKSDGVTLNDGAEHDIDIRFDAAVDTLQVLVDDAVVAEATDIEGVVSEQAYWDLTFGNPWGKQSFDGKVTAFDLDAVQEPVDIVLGSGPTLDDMNVF